MTEAAVSFAGNLTEDLEVRYTEARIARAMFRVAVSRRREHEPSFFTVVVWRDQAEHAAQSLSKGSRVVVVGRLQQRSWTAEDGSTRSVIEIVAEELGPSLRWATARPERISGTTSQRSRSTKRGGWGTPSRLGWPVSTRRNALPCDDLVAASGVRAAWLALVSARLGRWWATDPRQLRLVR
jgi:single-strand DNA-binding protein